MWYFRAVIPQQLRHGSTSIVVLRRSTGRWDFFVANPTCCMMNSLFLMVKPPCFVGLWVLVLIKPYQTSIFCSLFEWSITMELAEVHACGSPICRRWPLSAASKSHWAAKGCTRDVPGSTEPVQVGPSGETAWNIVPKMGRWTDLESISGLSGRRSQQNIRRQLADITSKRELLLIFEAPVPDCVPGVSVGATVSYSPAMTPTVAGSCTQKQNCSSATTSNTNMVFKTDFGW